MLRPFFSEIPLLSLVRTFLIPIFNHLKVSFSKPYGLLKRRQTKKESGKGGERKRGREGGGGRERERESEGRGKKDQQSALTWNLAKMILAGNPQPIFSKALHEAKLSETAVNSLPPLGCLTHSPSQEYLSSSLSLFPSLFFNLSICLPVYLHLSVLYICIALSFDSLNLCLPPN